MCVTTPIPYKYDVCVREDAIELTRTHGIAHASRTLGVTYQTVRKWAREFDEAQIALDLEIRCVASQRIPAYVRHHHFQTSRLP